MSEHSAPAIPRRDFTLLMLATVTALCNFAPLMTVVPLWAAGGGGSGAGVGATNGVMLGATAITQLAMGPVLARFTLKQIFVAGAAVMAAPTPFYLLSDQLAPVLVISAARGVGFGLLVVAASALVAEIVPSHLLARGLGIHGLGTGLPMVIALPAGVWVARQWSFTPVFVASTVLAVVGAVLASLLHAGGRPADERPGPAAGSVLLDPSVEADHTAGATELLESSPAEAQVRAGAATRKRRIGQPGVLGAIGPLLRPALAFFSLTMALGAVNTFLPLAVPDASVVSLALVVAPLAMITGRFGSGVLAGHLQPGRLVLPGAVVGAVGMGALALGAAPGMNSWLVVAGAGVFGLGLGVNQNDSLVVIMGRAGPRRRGLASTVWNFAYDAGMGSGAVIFGALLAGIDYPWAYGLAAVVIAVAAPVGRVRVGW
ncbi:MFS transporter [Pseudactinotalea sp. Z1732]|uniref:MFS transporter n=1 Tax=Pseudactinotalea sp. Z1732 TaxID=3413026 RepID=UPI003C7A74BC